MITFDHIEAHKCWVYVNVALFLQGHGHKPHWPWTRRWLLLILEVLAKNHNHADMTQESKLSSKWQDSNELSGN